MLIDEAKIVFRAGHGGAGRVSFYPGMTAGPDGGNGGRGGDVYLVATSDLTALRPFTTKKVKAAENGEMGGKNLKFGSDGKDIEVTLPIGSVITDVETGKVTELTIPGQRILFCKGGLGGRGNNEFKSSRRTTPEFAQPGLPGEEKDCLIELKLIADFGLIGLPNAGKSSLLNEITRAQAKVANYPFTTLEPNLGVLPNSKIIADIPGLIEGASDGKGLGIKFLKHIEKVMILLHCISAESEDPMQEYETITHELKEYNPNLLNKQEIIIITKSDTVEKEKLEKIINTFAKLEKEILTVSIYDYDSIENLKQELVKKITQYQKITAAGGIVLNSQGQIAIVNQFGEEWAFPKGKTELGEDPLATARREIREETGISQLEYMTLLGEYDYLSQGKQQLNNEKVIKTVKMYLFKTPDQELKPQDPHNPEAKWVNIDEIPHYIVKKHNFKFFNSIKNDLTELITLTFNQSESTE